MTVVRSQRRDAVALAFVKRAREKVGDGGGGGTSGEDTCKLNGSTVHGTFISSAARPAVSPRKEKGREGARGAH